MDEWGWEQLRPWIGQRERLPVGRLFCVIEGPTCGRPWAPGAVRTHLGHLAVEAGVRRRFAPHHYADLWIMPSRRSATHVLPATTRAGS
jgi:hypothetical protein